jgi:hypothetical protein
MRRPTKKTPPVSGTPNDEPPPPSAPGSIALPLTKAERIAAGRAVLTLVESKPARLMPRGPFASAERGEEERSAARRFSAENQLKAWERQGAEAVWQGEEDIAFGTWLEAPLPAYSIRGVDGSLNKSAVRFVSAWLEACAQERQAA